MDDPLPDPLPDLRRPGLARLEDELVVRDFLELLPVGAADELAPFLHADVRFEGGANAVAVGRSSVLGAWGSIAARFTTFEVEVVAAAQVGGRVLVEQRVYLSMAQHSSPSAVLGFASFDVRDARIVGWRQLFG